MPDPDDFRAAVEGWLDRLYIAAEGAGLREEDRRKARQVAALLAEIARATRRVARGSPLLLVDAAAGKAYVGLLAARLVLDHRPSARVVTIERDAARVAASRLAAERLQASPPIDCRAGDVADRSVWPTSATLVVALHACGAASDAVIDGTVASGARGLLLVPCCTGAAVEASRVAARQADRVGIPPHAPVRRRFIQAIVDAERTWRLEAAGYETEVVELVGATVTPHNLLWRARLVREPGRMARAAALLARLRSETA